ncbi:MAG TPA: PilX N-terminal domain-containing pilus assembly protein, partial [Xanthomonadales bacterium]|nr:PilX N-terminal domain-containing pilus assembly protein [Xanthomonadales bacterium]
MSCFEQQQRLRLAIPGRQRGAITIFTGIMVLLLLTGLLVYATRVGISEQRISANELRYKQAFVAAESGLEHAREYLLAHQILLNSAEDDLLPDGSDGWLSPTGVRWLKCSDHLQDFDSDTDPVELAHP